MLSVALAISTVLPGAVAVAQEPDQEREGAAAPEPAPPDGSADPGFDPGGETDLPSVGAPTDGGEDDSGDGPPVDVEPVTDPDALGLPLDDPGTAPDAAEGSDEPATPVEQPAPAMPSPVPVPPPAVAPQADAPSTPTGKRRPSDRGEANTTRKRARDRVQRRPVIRVTIPAPVPAPAPAATPAAPAVEPAAATTTTAADKPAQPGQRSYRVQTGDSLWKIASDLLGAGATNAEIVAESNRIYQLNRDRIGPDPDALVVGAVLRLR